VHIHGNQPSPLFNSSDPWWNVYRGAGFLPEASQLTRIAPDALLLRNWTFHKHAWVMASQVRAHAHGLHGPSSWRAHAWRGAGRHRDGYAC
jgi:hypothetical protein